MEFLRDLTESRLLPNRQALRHHTPRALADLAVLSLFCLRVLLVEPETHAWARHYCARTARGTDFHRWRQDGTDLYVLLHVLSGSEEKLGGSDSDAERYRDRLGLFPQTIFRWVLHGAQHRLRPDHRDRDPHHQETCRLFARLDAMFLVQDGALRSLRRMVQDWPTLDQEERQTTLLKLMRLLRARTKKSDFDTELQRLAAVLDIDVEDRVAEEQAPRLGLLLALENATAGATGAASVAAVVGGLGAGFDNDYAKSIYPAPKKQPKVSIIRRRNDEDDVPVK